MDHTEDIDDTITLSESLVSDFEQGAADTLTLSDELINGIGYQPTDTLTLSDGEVKVVGLGKGDTLTLSDDAPLLFGKQPADTLTMSDSVSGKNLTTVRADTMTLFDNALKRVPEQETINSGSIRPKVGSATNTPDGDGGRV
jgi:hypothetical protein